MSSTSTQLTQVTVRALALGGKFIGDGVGYATVTISQGNKVLAKGTTGEGTPRFSDGSGITGLIMAEPYPWGAPVRADDSTAFTASLAITVPTLVTITVQAPASSTWASQAVTVSAQRWILPGLNLTGQCAVVLVVPGLLVGWNGPPSIASGGAISASVHMMCGCAIDNLFWPGENFNVVANLTPKGGGATTPVPLTWSSTSTFSGPVAAAAGTYDVRVFAVEVLNGNTGSATGTLTITK
jgi:hypothetical protein